MNVYVNVILHLTRGGSAPQTSIVVPKKNSSVFGTHEFESNHCWKMLGPGIYLSLLTWITGWWCNHHLEKYEFVNGFRMTSHLIIMEVIKAMFQTTNQIIWDHSFWRKTYGILWHYGVSHCQATRSI